MRVPLCARIYVSSVRKTEIYVYVCLYVSTVICVCVCVYLYWYVEEEVVEDILQRQLSLCN